MAGQGNRGPDSGKPDEMSLKARKRWSLVVLLLWLPIWAEVPVYILLAFAWAIPFRGVFRGIGRGE